MARERLIEDLRSWAQRHPRGSNERRLMHEAADELEKVRARRRTRPEPDITVEVVERALGGKSLLPWQKKALGGE